MREENIPLKIICQDTKTYNKYICSNSRDNWQMVYKYYNILICFHIVPTLPPTSQYEEFHNTEIYRNLEMADLVLFEVTKVPNIIKLVHKINDFLKVPTW